MTDEQYKQALIIQLQQINKHLEELLKALSRISQKQPYVHPKAKRPQ